MSQRVNRRYGLPFNRCMMSIARHLVPSDALGPDSHDMLHDPVEGTYFRRGGSQNYGGTTGLLENPAFPTLGLAGPSQCRKMLSFRSTSESSGFPVMGWLWEQLAINGDSFQCFGWRTANGGGANHVLGDSFAGNYPDYCHYMPMEPFWGARLNNAQRRGQALIGCRNILDAGEKIIFPNRGTGRLDYGRAPISWDKKFQNGNTHEHVRPVGKIPPLWPPTVTTPIPTVLSNPAFVFGNYFFISVIFVDNDGSPSMPFMPRQVTADFPYSATDFAHPGGFGMVRIGNNGDPQFSQYDYLDLSNIPIGPDGTAKRIVLATPQSNDWQTLKILNEDGTLNLQIWATINNNTQTTLRMTDFALTQDPNLVRIDHISMPPAAYVWSGDQRIWACNTGINPLGFYISPNQNNLDITPGATVYEAKVTGPGTTLNLGKGGTFRTIVYTGLKLQDLVDKINAMQPAAPPNDFKYYAAIAPGADPTMDCSNITDWTQVGTSYGDSGAGLMRCFSNAMPGIVYMPTPIPPIPGGDICNLRRVFFTAGGAAQSAVAVDAWRAANYRDIPQHAGEVLGGGHTFYGQVVCCTKGIAIIRNIKNVKTGEDADYRLEMINDRRGCVSSDSIVWLDGAVGYMTAEGYIVNDGLKEINISGDVYNPSTQMGEWAYEVQRALGRGTAWGNAGLTNTLLFPSTAVPGRILVMYQSNPSSPYPDSMLVYDFSSGVAASGAPNFLNNDIPWGWSAPIRWGQFGIKGGPVGWMSYQSGSGAPVIGYFMGGQSMAAWQGRVEQILIPSVAWDRDGYNTINLTTTAGQIQGTTVDDLSRHVDGTSFMISPNLAAGTRFVGASWNPVAGNWTVHLSVAATGTGTAVTTVTGTTIQSAAYGPTDMCETFKKKSVVSITPMYFKPGAPLKLMLSKDRWRNTQFMMSLSQSLSYSETYSRQVKTPPQAARGPGDVVEIAFIDDGTFLGPAKVWGAEVEVDILDSVR